jgi:hypothetical protein
MPGLGLGLSMVFRRGAVDRPQGAITGPSAGFEWTVGDVVTISGTCIAKSERTISAVVVAIRGAAIAEDPTIDNEAHTWTVDHTVLIDDVWYAASIAAMITDSAGKSVSTLPVAGVIYPDGGDHVYVGDSDTGEWVTEDDDFVIKDY